MALLQFFTILLQLGYMKEFQYQNSKHEKYSTGPIINIVVLAKISSLVNQVNDTPYNELIQERFEIELKAASRE